MNFPPMRTASRAFQFAGAPGVTSTAHTQTCNKSLTIKSTRKFLRSLGLLFFALGSLAVSKTANAQWLLVNYHSGLCIGITADVYQVGTGLIQWPCNTFDISQNWFRGDVTPPGFAGSTTGQVAATLLSASYWNPQVGEFVMDLGTNGAFPPFTDGQGVANSQDGQVIIDREGSPVTGQQGWVFIPANKTIAWQNGEATCYFIQNAGFTRSTPYNLGVSGGSTSQGAPVVTWVDSDSMTNHPDQIWCWAISAL